MHFKQHLLFSEQEIIENLKDGGLLISRKIICTMSLFPLVKGWIVDTEYLQDELQKGLKEYSES